uniref:C-CAP/cofactor C-like domain-containing protein n=3 Tax=Parascaris TaxID=6254 RepID=A0A915B873_PARUN
MQMFAGLRMYICVWPRGLLTFNIDLSSLSTRKNAANPVVIACHMVQYHMFQSRNPRISAEQWCDMLTKKARVTPGVAKALFEVGRLVEVSLGAKDIPLNLQEGDGTVSLVTVALVCALWRSRIAQSSKGPFTAEETWPSFVRAKGQRVATTTAATVLTYIRRNLSELCAMILLCDEQMAERFIHSPNGACFIPSDAPVHLQALQGLDMLFEGYTLDRSDAGPYPPNVIQPLPLSTIVERHWTDNGKITFDDLRGHLAVCLQTDPFGIHDRPVVSIGSTRGGFPTFSEVNTPRSKNTPNRSVDTASETISAGKVAPRRATRKKHLSNTCFSRDRKFVVSRWTHIEVLNKEVLSGCHLRIMNGDKRSSWLFAPQCAESAVVADCHGCGPIIFGPVRNTLFLQGLSECTVSAVCSRLVIERCDNITVYVCVPLSPLIIDSHRVRLAPYNAPYDFLQFALEEAKMKLCQSNGKWDQPLLVRNFFMKGEEDDSGECGGIFSIMDASEFQTLALPLSQRNEDIQKMFLSSLPTAFSKALEERPKNVDKKMRPIGVEALTEQDWIHLSHRARNATKQLHFSKCFHTYAVTSQL